MIGGFGAGMPRSGEMPKAGDLLRSIGAGARNSVPPQKIAPATLPQVSNPENGTASSYSIGEIHDNNGIIQQGPTTPSILRRNQNYAAYSRKRLRTRMALTLIDTW